jgi:hypothetical protein
MQIDEHKQQETAKGEGENLQEPAGLRVCIPVNVRFIA